MSDFIAEYLKDMPSDWGIKSIDQVSSRVGSGVTPTGGSEVYKDDGIIFLRSQNIKFEGLDLSDVAFIDEKQHRFMRNSEVFTFDVLINITGASIGRCCFVPEDMGKANQNQHVCTIRLLAPNESDAKFLSSVLASPIGQRQIFRLNAGGNREGLNYQQLRSFKLPWPIGRTRSKIAVILITIDKAIEQTEALIHKYQQIKAGLMHDLFTRGLTADGRLRPPREQAPELYQETPIGWIPKEWDWGPLSNYINGSPKNGYSPSEIDEWDGCASLGLGCLTCFGFRAIQLKVVARKAALRSGAILKDGDFLISRANTPQLVGLCGVYEDIGSPCIYPDLMMRIQPNAFIYSNYLEQYLLSAEVRIRLTALAVGTSMSMVKLNSKSLINFTISAPRMAEQVQILHRSGAIDKYLKMLTSDLRKLRHQKSGLMHDLLTGRVRVKVAESNHQEAAA